jgi:hypothetical protein
VRQRRHPRPAEEKPRACRASDDKDAILWSQDQARLLRAGRYSELDIEHLADEIEDVGRSETRTGQLHGRAAGASSEMAQPAGNPHEQLAGDDLRTNLRMCRRSTDFAGEWRMSSARRGRRNSPSIS